MRSDRASTILPPPPEGRPAPIVIPQHPVDYFFVPDTPPTWRPPPRHPGDDE
jgi:hypothetical protein